MTKDIYADMTCKLSQDLFVSVHVLLLCFSFAYCLKYDLGFVSIITQTNKHPALNPSTGNLQDLRIRKQGSSTIFLALGETTAICKFCSKVKMGN